MRVYVHVCACVYKCFVLYVIYSQHCKHTETIIHVLALIHWIWLTSLEHHKRSNDLGWTRTQWRIKIEGFWRASGGPFKVSSYRQADVPVGLVSAVLEKKLRKWATKSSSSSRDRMSTLSFIWEEHFPHQGAKLTLEWVDHGPTQEGRREGSSHKQL